MIQVFAHDGIPINNGIINRSNITNLINCKNSMVVSHLDRFSSKVIMMKLGIIIDIMEFLTIIRSVDQHCQHR